MTKKPQDNEQWEALLRGQVMAATTQKFINFVRLADQKAQGLIILNSLLIPVVINWTLDGEFTLAAMTSLFASILSILTAIFSIYPKRRAGKKPDGTLNLLHFGDIGRLEEEDYLKEFMPVFNDTEKLTKAAAIDLHDTAKRIILPKFKWLKLSYAIFFAGNILAIIIMLINW